MVGVWVICLISVVLMDLIYGFLGMVVLVVCLGLLILSIGLVMFM